VAFADSWRASTLKDRLAPCASRCFGLDWAAAVAAVGSSLRSACARDSPSTASASLDLFLAA
jgi:hypothetical protein